MNTQTTATAIQALYPHFPALFRQACGLCRDADQAEDLTLDTLLHAAECFHTFRGGSLRAWLGTSLQRRFQDNCRHSSLFLTVALDALDGDVLPDRSAGPGAKAFGRILTQDALARCQYPTLFLAVALNGESLTDLARRTGENVSTLTARVRRDRERLRTYLTAS